MAIDVVTWIIIKKGCIWSLHLHNFLWLPTCSLLRYFFENYTGCHIIIQISYIYFLKLKLCTPKCIDNNNTNLREVSVSSTMVRMIHYKLRHAQQYFWIKLNCATITKQKKIHGNLDRTWNSKSRLRIGTAAGLTVTVSHSQLSSQCSLLTAYWKLSHLISLTFCLLLFSFSLLSFCGFGSLDW